MSAAPGDDVSNGPANDPMKGHVFSARLAIGGALKPIWHHCGVVALARWLAGRRGAILRYHSVTDDESQTLSYLDHGLMVTPATFRSHLRYLGRYYVVVTLDEMVNCIHQGKPLPPRAVAITFDDGYRDNYTQAYPLLREASLPATFYITTSCVGGGPPLWTAKLRFMTRQTRRRHLALPSSLGPDLDIRNDDDRQSLFTRLVVRLKNMPSRQRWELLETLEEILAVGDFSPLKDIMMTWDELAEMSRNGMTIGAHTMSHPNLPNTDVAEATEEIAGSREIIAAKLRRPVVHFSYPNGRGSAHLTDAVRLIVRRLEFRSAVTSVPGCVRPGADPWALRRVGIYNRHAHIPSFSLDVERSRLRRAA